MKSLERWRTGASPGGKNDSKESSRRLALPKTHYLEKRADGQIRQFAGILQAPETSGKVSCRLCTAEVRGSNPLGSTLGIRRFAGEMRRVKRGQQQVWPSCTPLEHQRSSLEKTKTPLKRELMSDQRTILKLKTGFWSAPNSRNHIGSSISVPHAVVMSPRSMISVQPKLWSSSVTLALASASSPHTNTVWSAPASCLGSTMR